MVEKSLYHQKKFIYQEIARKLAYFFSSIELADHLIYKNKTILLIELLT